MHVIRNIENCTCFYYLPAVEQISVHNRIGTMDLETKNQKRRRIPNEKIIAAYQLVKMCEFTLKTYIWQVCPDEGKNCA